jgi:hypothetical protein
VGKYLGGFTPCSFNLPAVHGDISNLWALITPKTLAVTNMSSLLINNKNLQKFSQKNTKLRKGSGQGPMKMQKKFKVKNLLTLPLHCNII